MIMLKRLLNTGTLLTIMFCTPLYSSAALSEQQSLKITQEVINLYLLNKKLDKNDFDEFLMRNKITSNEVIVLLKDRKSLVQQQIVQFKNTQSPIGYWAAAIAGSVTSLIANIGYNTEQEKTSQTISESMNYHVLRSGVMNSLWRQRNSGWITPAEYDDEVKNFPREYGYEPTVYESPFILGYRLLLTGGVIMAPFVAYKLYGYYKHEYDRKKEIELIDIVIEQINALIQN